MMLLRQQRLAQMMNPLRRFSTVQLSSVKREDVLSSSDTKWVGSYAEAVMAADDATHADALDEYMRRNFRKLSSAQAMDVINGMANQTDKASACLDGKFWVWESLEEALRPELLDMSYDDFMNTGKVFHANYKGSDDFSDLWEQRLYREEDPFAKEEAK